MKWQNEETGIICESNLRPSSRHIPFNKLSVEENKFERLLKFYTCVGILIAFATLAAFLLPCL